MKLGRADLRKLQPGILLVVLAVAVGVAAVYLANQAKADAQKARLVVRTQLQEADGKLKQVRQEETEVKQKSIVFNKLAERGIIGDEQRLDWVELLKEIRDKHRLIDLQYEISPQRMLDKPGDDFSFFVSAMKVQLKLLHEEDLLRLLDALRSQAKALVRVRSCQVERLPATGDDRSGGRAHLLADCEIDWLTLRDVRKK